MTDNATEPPVKTKSTPKPKSDTSNGKTPRKGQENLIPMNKLTVEEQREIAVKGGKASVIARRRNKTFREIFEVLMDTPVKDSTVDEIADLPSLQGLEKRNFVVKDIIALQQIQKAMNGDTKAYEAIRDQIGEIIEQKMRMDIGIRADEDKLSELKKKLDSNPDLLEQLLK